jgi:hypothetical protein
MPDATKGIVFCATFGNVNTMAKKPTTFDELLDLWEQPRDLSDALGVSRLNARAMKLRKSVGIDHWPALITALKAKGVSMTWQELAELRQRRREVA